MMRAISCETPVGAPRRPPAPHRMLALGDAPDDGIPAAYAVVAQADTSYDMGAAAAAMQSAIVATDVPEVQQRQAAPPNPVSTKAPQGLSVEQVIAQAVAEGLMLHVANTNTGYKGVYQRIPKPTKRDSAKVTYQAQLKVDGKVRTIGNFPSAAEAALAYTRTLRELDLAGVRKRQGRPRGRSTKDDQGGVRPGIYAAADASLSLSLQSLAAGSLRVPSALLAERAPQ